MIELIQSTTLAMRMKIGLCGFSGILYTLWIGLKEGNVLLNDALNTFYLRLYGIGHMVNDHSDSERGNPLLPHGLLFSD